MIKSGDVISYLKMCQIEGANLQRGMNFRLKGIISVILMSLRRGAPYADRVEEDGNILIYEGHNTPKINDRNPKTIDQPMFTPNGELTQNGLFYNAAIKYKEQNKNPEVVKVYEKLYSGVWIYNGLFELIDVWYEKSNNRKIFKFKLKITNERIENVKKIHEIDHNRIIPSSVKLEVWKRDKGKCVICGAMENLHFDHIIPYSKGGSSLVANNIQLLCVKHNLGKRDKIE